MPHPTPHSLTPSLPHSPSSCVVYIDADMVTAVAWAPDSQLVSCSDDKSLGRWTAEGAAAGARIGVDVFVAHVSWFPSVGKQVPLTPALTHSLTHSPPLARLPLTLLSLLFLLCVCVWCRLPTCSPRPALTEPFAFSRGPGARRRRSRRTKVSAYVHVCDAAVWLLCGCCALTSRLCMCACVCVHGAPQER